MATQHQRQRPHTILFAFPLQGHVIPAAHLAVNLASRGITVTFVNTESIHHQTSKTSNGGDDIFAAARGSGLDIRYATVSDGLPAEYDRAGHHEEFMASMLHAMRERVEEFVGEVVRRSEPRVTCLIADTFYVWLSGVANKFGVSCASFWTEPALVFSLYYHMHLLTHNRHFDCSDIRKDPIDYIPGVTTIDTKDLPSYLQQKDTSTLYHQTISKAFKDVRHVDFVLCNTVKELEPRVIATIQDQKPFYAIGPLFPPGLAKGTMATSLWSELDCTSWLDSKARGSVLYVSFGSLAHLTKRDLVEIANGLLDSKVSFIWVLRPDIVISDDADPLPVGYREAICDRGMIVPWCSQIQMLAHPAIRGFLTHCGWNSLLEAIWCEVPLLCFPFFTDQLTNRKLVVDDWKVGINLIDREVIMKEEVSEKVGLLMDGNLWDQLKVAMREIKMEVQDALSPNGSSVKNMECFIKDLNAKAQAQCP